MPNTISRRPLLAAFGVAALAAPPFNTHGRTNPAAVRIGCLTDLNGPYADLVGKSVVGNPLEDTPFAPSTIRADGQVMRDMLMLEVNRPTVSTESWDTCSIVSTLPADGLYAPFGSGGCKLIHA